MGGLQKIMGRVAVPLVTPFQDNEEVNFDSLRELADFVIRNDFCDSLILTGTTGEFHTMDDEERIAIWKAGKEAAAGRVPVVAGAGAASTRQTIKLAKIAEELGFDAVMVVLPYYAHPPVHRCQRGAGDLGTAGAGAQYPRR